jgi:hypothetical protein
MVSFNLIPPLNLYFRPDRGEYRMQTSALSPALSDLIGQHDMFVECFM